MAKYILVKKVKGKKYEYQVIDVDSKAIVSKRTSAREYVACTRIIVNNGLPRTPPNNGLPEMLNMRKRKKRD